MRKFILITGFILLGWAIILAQDVTPEVETEEDPLLSETILLNGQIMVGVPTGTFAENLGTSGVGGGGSLYFLVSKVRPIYLGFEMNGMNYDQQSGQAVLTLDNGPTNVQLETRTSLFNGHAVTRYAPWVNFFVQPYFEGAVGFRNLFTKTLFTDIDAGDEEPFDRTIEMSDWALSYGGGLGFNIYLGNANGVGFKVDAKVLYLKGQAADYNVRIPNFSGPLGDPIDVFEERNSTTDLLTIQLGIQIAFGYRQFQEMEFEE